jgi:large subunit ribosomal protein L15
MDILSKLSPPEGATKDKRRLGRGRGSGIGKTCGRGQKGQKARVGHSKRGFEGGQMPLQRRMPKRGFRNPFGAVIAEVTVGSLEAFANGTEVTLEALCDCGLLKGRYDRVKVLGTGTLSKKLTVTAHAFSSGALSKIEQAGGKAVVLASAVPKAAPKVTEAKS